MSQLLASIPHKLEKLINDYELEPVTIGMSGASVFYLQAPGKPGLYLKFSPAGSGRDFRPAVERLHWLQGKLPVPEVLYFEQTEAGEYLLLSEIAGPMACDPSFETEPELLVKLLAAGLKMLHAVDIKECPFDGRLDGQLEAARQRVEVGLVDEADFDAERQGLSAAEVYAELVRTRPASEDLVFTHGDYCLPNVLLDPASQKVSGFIDLGRCGVADRYQDLALAARSLEYNFRGVSGAALFAEYGLKEIDWAKVEYYKLLDEFF